MRYIIFLFFLFFKFLINAQTNDVHFLLSASSAITPEIEGRFNQYSIGIGYGFHNRKGNNSTDINLLYNSNDVYGSQMKNTISIQFYKRRHFIMGNLIRPWIGCNIGYSFGKDKPVNTKIVQIHTLLESGIEVIFNKKYLFNARFFQLGYFYKISKKVNPLRSSSVNFNDPDGFPFQLMIGYLF